MGRRAAWIGAGFACILGFGIGNSTDPAPKTEVVRVPQVKTHIEYRDKEIVKPWPESCKRAAQLIQDSTANDSAITGSAGEILLALDKLARVGATDPMSVNPTIEEVRAAKNTLDGAVVDREELLSTAKINIEKCLTALNE